jgi:hypothetical protein
MTPFDIKPPPLWFAVQVVVLVWAIGSRRWWVVAIVGIIFAGNLAIAVRRRKGSR